MKQSDRKLFKRIIFSYKPYLGIFIIGALATFLMSGVDSVFPLGIKLLIDKGLNHPDAAAAHLMASSSSYTHWMPTDSTFTRWMPIAVIVLSLLRALGSVGSRYFMSRVARSVVMDYRRGLFCKLFRLPASYYDHHSTGHLLSTLLYNTDQIVQAGVDVLVRVMQDGSATIGLLAMMCYSSWRLFLMVLVFGPPIALVAGWASRRMRKMSKGIQQGMGDVTHIAEEGIKNYRMIRIYGGEDYERGKFFYSTRKNLSRQLKVTIISALSSASMQVFIAIPLAIIFYIFKATLLHITAGSLVAFITSMGMLVKPLRRIMGLNSQIQQGLAGAEGVFDVIDIESESDTGTRTLQRAQGEVEFKDINFQYLKAEGKTLHDISFKIKPSQTVALVGRSGSGKTTIASLLPRFYDADSGQVLIDGTDVHDYKLSDLRAQFSLVSQNVTLFNDTVARNIAYGMQADATEAQIIAAAEAANALEFIKELPQGLDTLVGENGVLLSGGQRQRIAIARAILKSAPILILDEATSALDTETERHIQVALDRLMQKCTSLVIAHRLSTVENADWIIVMDGGRIIEQGTHDDLIQLNNAYALLYRMQFNEVAAPQATPETTGA